MDKDLREIVEIHDTILKDHDLRLQALENGQRELRSDMKAVRLDTQYIRGRIDALTGVLNSGNTYTYLKYGGLLLLGGLLFELLNGNLGKLFNNDVIFIVQEVFKWTQI